MNMMVWNEDEIQRTVRQRLREEGFRPEFINRIDEVIIFHQIEREQMKNIVDIQINRLQPRLAERHITLQLSEDAREFLANEGYDPQFGARPLKRVIQKEVENRIARAILDIYRSDVASLCEKFSRLAERRCHLRPCHGTLRSRNRRRERAIARRRSAAGTGRAQVDRRCAREPRLTHGAIACRRRTERRSRQRDGEPPVRPPLRPRTEPRAGETLRAAFGRRPLRSSSGTSRPHAGALLDGGRELRCGSAIERSRLRADRAAGKCAERGRARAAVLQARRRRRVRRSDDARGLRNRQNWAQRMTSAYGIGFDAITALRFGDDATAYRATNPQYGNPAVHGWAALLLGRRTEAAAVAARIDASKATGGYLTPLFLARVAEADGDAAKSSTVDRASTGRTAPRLRRRTYSARSGVGTAWCVRVAIR